MTAYTKIVYPQRSALKPDEIILRKFVATLAIPFTRVSINNVFTIRSFVSCYNKYPECLKIIAIARWKSTIRGSFV